MLELALLVIRLVHASINMLQDKYSRLLHLKT